MSEFRIIIDDAHEQAALDEIARFRLAAENKTIGDYGNSGFLYHLLCSLGAFEIDAERYVEKNDGVVRPFPAR